MISGSKVPKPLIWLFLLAVGWAAGGGQALAEDAESPPIQVGFELVQAPGPDIPLEFDIVLNIEEGYYVYSKEEYSFGFEIEAQRGLADQASLRLPPTLDIPDLLSVEEDATTPVFVGEARIRAVVESRLADPGEEWSLTGAFTYQACTDTFCLRPERVATSLGDGSAVAESAAERGAGWAGRGWLWGVGAAFLAGIALSLTPCVYPMIGVTVAVIGGSSAGRGRTVWLTFVYVLGLSLAYAAAGVGVALLGSRAAEFFRSPYVLSAIGLLFVLLALSLFDVFSLSLPSSLMNRLQGVGKRGSTGGVFAMGLVSALVVGPCISGPLISLITFVATTGSVLLGFLYFFALAWGMGLLLFVAGSASGALPRAGVWMVRVKHVLGVVLLWAAFYFARPVVGELIYYAATASALAAAAGVSGILDFASREGVGRRRLRQTGAALIAVGLIFGINLWLVRTVVREADMIRPGVDRTVELAAELAHGEVVLLEFWAPWCAICKHIERTVIEDPEMAAILEEIRVVKVHYDHNRELNRKYDLIGPPAFVFLRPDGRRIGPILVTGEELREAIENRIWRQAAE